MKKENVFQGLFGSIVFLSPTVDNEKQAGADAVNR